MFKIGDEVMDRAGKYYTVMGVGFGSYELMTEDGQMRNGMLNEWLAKYNPASAENLADIAASITRIEGLVDQIKNSQTQIFERARRK